jgi:hypothetical protein
VEEKNIKFPVRYDDMFPYKDNSKSYWTGYFTSRPQLKSSIREASRVLHASDKLFSLAALKKEATQEEVDSMLTVTQDMHGTIGDMQHHDAVTGTSPKNVVSTYLTQISESVDLTYPVFT